MLRAHHDLIEPGPDVAAMVTRPSLHPAASRVMHDYQRVAYTWGPLLAAGLLVVLAALVTRRGAWRLRLDAALLAALTLLALTVSQALSVFSYRYVLIAWFGLPVAAALPSRSPIAVRPPSERRMTLRITHIGGPTTLIEVAGRRILTDPTFDAPGRRYAFGWGTSSRKLVGPALAPEAIGAVDAVLLTHEHHYDNLDVAETGALLPQRRRSPPSRARGGSAAPHAGCPSGGRPGSRRPAARRSRSRRRRAATGRRSATRSSAT